MEKISSVGRIKKDFTDKEFLREVLIFLYNSPAPTDIFDSKFYNVKEQEVEFICATAEVNITYSCSVGYDRVETYLGEEEYRDTHNQKRKRIVEKTRTVTDWSPHNGAAQTQETCFIRNSLNVVDNSTEEQFFAEAIKDSEFENLEEYEMQVEDTVLNSAEQLCGNHCFNSVILPGDQQKDVSWRGTVNIYELAGFLITEYSIKFEYKGNEFEAKAFGSGNPKINCNVPTSLKESKAINKKVLIKTVPFFIAEIALIIFAAVVNILNISSWGINKGILDVILVVCLVGVVIAHIIVRNVLIKKSRIRAKNEKLNELNFLLRKFKLGYYE